MSEKAIRILIVDDHPFVREGLIKIIDSEPGMEVYGEAESVDEALLKIKTAQPDVVLVDISLHQSNGIDLICTLNDLTPSVPILVISMHEETVYVTKAMQAGAKGYILKRESVVQVPKAIRQILSGQIYVSEAVSSAMISTITNHPAIQDPQSVLSGREWEIFQLMGQGKVRHTISEELGISVRTVDTHIDRIKTKLGLTSVSQVTCAAAKQEV